ncbi:MAG: zinc-binding alcohol dehydrogenase family protein, partial [Deltaproteobacteria bacterium]
MQAMVLERNAPVTARPLVLSDIERPQPQTQQILVRVTACGVCRTDLHVIEAELPPQKLPVVPGHQIVGVVERLGTGCKRFAPGDRVGIAWLRRTCGGCVYCSTGYENLCERSRYTGYHEDGGFAEYAVVDEDFAYAIPEPFSDVDAAPLLCAGIIGYRALSASEVRPGERLALYGFGSSAHIVMQIALHRGCEVFVATRGESHRRLAREMGAAWVGEATEPLPAPADGAIVFAPAGEIVPAALRGVRKAGVVALAGIYMTPIPELPYEPCLFHEKKLRSVEANTRADGEGLLAE